MRAARAGSSISRATARYACAPRLLRSKRITGLPYDGASERRTLRGICVLKICSGKYFSSSRITSSAKRVRPSNIVTSTPLTCSVGLSASRTRQITLGELRESFERVELGLHRNDAVVRGGQRVDRQQSERRRRIDQHEVVARRDRRERLTQARFARERGDELDVGAGEIDRRGREPQILDFGVAR